MDKDVLTLLARENSGFSKGQKRIANYIAENYDKAAFMTAGKLGKAAGVSESTVVRFAAELGYGGYPAMRKALQELLRGRLTSVQRIEAARETMDEEHLLESVIRADMEKLQTTLDECDHAVFSHAADVLAGARHVYIVGMRSSTCLANFLGFYLNLLRENVHVIQNTAVSAVYEQIMRIGEGDVFVGITYPRYSNGTARAMGFAKFAGADTVGITDGENSPFVGVADTLLFAKSDMVSFLDSLVAPMSLINALIVAVASRMDNDVESTFRTLESIWRDYEVYEKQ